MRGYDHDDYIDAASWWRSRSTIAEATAIKRLGRIRFVRICHDL